MWGRGVQVPMIAALPRAAVGAPLQVPWLHGADTTRTDPAAAETIQLAPRQGGGVSSAGAVAARVPHVPVDEAMVAVMQHARDPAKAWCTTRRAASDADPSAEEWRCSSTLDRWLAAKGRVGKPHAAVAARVDFARLAEASSLRTSRWDAALAALAWHMQAVDAASRHVSGGRGRTKDDDDPPLTLPLLAPTASQRRGAQQKGSATATAAADHTAVTEHLAVYARNALQLLAAQRHVADRLRAAALPFASEQRAVHGLREVATRVTEPLPPTPNIEWAALVALELAGVDLRRQPTEDLQRLLAAVVPGVQRVPHAVAFATAVVVAVHGGGPLLFAGARLQDVAFRPKRQAPKVGMLTAAVAGGAWREALTRIGHGGASSSGKPEAEPTATAAFVAALASDDPWVARRVIAHHKLLMAVVPRATGGGANSDALKQGTHKTMVLTLQLRDALATAMLDVPCGPATVRARVLRVFDPLGLSDAVGVAPRDVVLCAVEAYCTVGSTVSAVHLLEPASLGTAAIGTATARRRHLVVPMRVLTTLNTAVAMAVAKALSDRAEFDALPLLLRGTTGADAAHRKCPGAAQLVIADGTASALAELQPRVPRAAIYERHGMCRVCLRCLRKAWGSRLQKHDAAVVAGTSDRVRVVHSAPDVLVLHKPRDMWSSLSPDASVVRALMQAGTWRGSERDGAAAATPALHRDYGLMQRLDAGTTGLVTACTTNDAIADAYRAHIQERTWKKEYVCLVVRTRAAPLTADEATASEASQSALFVDARVKPLRLSADAPSRQTLVGALDTTGSFGRSGKVGAGSLDIRVLQRFRGCHVYGPCDGTKEDSNDGSAAAASRQLPRELQHHIRHVTEAKLPHDVFLLRVTLPSGRRHHIRQLLANAGYPILNDTFYDPLAASPLMPPRCFALHASALEYRAGGRRVCIDTALPDDMAAVVEKLSEFAEGDAASEECCHSL